MSDATRLIRRVVAPLGPWRARQQGRLRDRYLMLKGGDAAVVESLNVSDGAAPATGRLVREGRLVRLRAHLPGNRAAFQRWYADEEIVRLLRHDQTPLNEMQSRSYFDTIILPLSTRDLSYAIHETTTDALIGTTALTDTWPGADSALFRIVIGEKDRWGRGYGTEATALVAWEAFLRHELQRVKLEVFRQNDRAIRAYLRIGFREVGEHIEWVGIDRRELHVVEMVLEREAFLTAQDAARSERDDVGDAPIA